VRAVTLMNHNATLKPNFTHRPTSLPGAEPARDRAVLCDGIRIGRVFEIDIGPRAGQWRWASYWIGHDNAGVAHGLDLALEAVEARATSEAIEGAESRQSN